MPAPVIGRDAELAVLVEFIERLLGGAAALVLEGEAGIGKTTLSEACVAEAEERGLLVLQARPAESETALGFSGIGDLLDPVLEEALTPLPAPQRRALARALVLEEGGEGPDPDPHAVGVAVLNVLRGLAAERPVLVAVDDVQWLDAASVGALGYAARRLRNERVGVLLASRPSFVSVLVAELRRALQGDRFVAVEVGPLDVGALHHLVREHLGIALARPLLAEVHQASGGNPFYALEIVRALKRTGMSVEAGKPLPVPRSLQELVRGRVLALPPASRDYLLAAAAHAHPTTSLVEAAAGIGDEAGLLPALDAHIVELETDRIRFTHPLLAAAVYETADRARRRRVHARLAELLEDPEARGWQLAAATDGPDDDVAASLEEAARHARGRGALRPAALLLDRARELTPVDRSDDAHRRAIDAAYLHFEAGDSRRAEAQLRELIVPLAPGPHRARALVVLARIRLYEAPAEARTLFAQVIEEAADEQTLALAHDGVAACGVWMYERLEESLEHADVALALAAQLGDDALAGDVLMLRLSAETLLGKSKASATAEHALALQAATTRQRVLDQPLASLAEYWIWTERHERARDALGKLIQAAHHLGDENARPWLLCLLTDVERRLGNLARSVELAREAENAADQSGQPLFRGLSIALESLAEAELGQAESARESARRTFEVGPDRQAGILASAALGHLELSHGRASEAMAQLGPRLAFVRREQIVEPGATRFVVDLVEAFIELGQGMEAVEVLDWYEANARRLGRLSAIANCLRCRGLLAAHAGALDDARAAFGEALQLHEQAQIPLDRGRTLLALGAAQRRARRRREARDTLQRALDVFEALGAAQWAERVRGEIRRVSGRAPSAGALTPAEERVAALVAQGKTNREVAAALFLSERTVEGHLSRVFAKLGVKHRADVARVLAAGQIQGISRSNPGESPVSAGPLAP